MPDLLLLSGHSYFNGNGSATECKLGVYSDDISSFEEFFLIWDEAGTNGAVSLYRLDGFTRFEVERLERGETVDVYTEVETGSVYYLHKDDLLCSCSEDFVETVSLTATFVPDYEAIEAARLATIPTEEELSALMGTKEEYESSVEGDWSDLPKKAEMIRFPIPEEVASTLRDEKYERPTFIVLKDDNTVVWKGSFLDLIPELAQRQERDGLIYSWAFDD